jgi:hypothetical protein
VQQVFFEMENLEVGLIIYKWPQRTNNQSVLKPLFLRYYQLLVILVYTARFLVIFRRKFGTHCFESHFTRMNF